MDNYDQIDHFRSLKIAETALEDRPRERLLECGAAALANHELLAIILRSGTKNLSVIDLSKSILNYFNNSLYLLGKGTAAELMLIPGIGPAKATEIMATIALAGRFLRCKKDDYYKINSPSDVYDIMSEKVRDLNQETFFCLILNTKNCITKIYPITTGLLDRVQVHPREIFRPAIHHNAHRIILVHNHPSGDPTPSSQDIDATKVLVDSSDILGIQILDHIIVGAPSNRNPLGYVSLKEEGLF